MKKALHIKKKKVGYTVLVYNKKTYYDSYLTLISKYEINTERYQLK